MESTIHKDLLDLVEAIELDVISNNFDLDHESVDKELYLKMIKKYGNNKLTTFDKILHESEENHKQNIS